ncbi:MAG: hypothetical protein HYX24_01465 [Candidatus Aenigmarchaeota archaeon]|nr:hypothetical protein [Candidatus Aenigmarchaeota archaeon]
MSFGKARKGSEAEEMGPEIIGFIVLALVLLIIIASGGQGIAKLFEFMCKNLGIFCATSPQDDKTSIESYTALVCATNTVMSGQIYDSDECYQLYVTPEAAEEAKSKERSEKAEVVKDIICKDTVCCLTGPETGFRWLPEKECGSKYSSDVCEKNIGPNPGPKCKPIDRTVIDCREGQKKQVTCEKCSVPPYGPLRMLPIVADTNEKAQEKCRKEAEKLLKGTVEEGNAKLAKAEDCKEEEVVKSCKILGFSLPDDFGGFASPKEFIYGAGNPSYLVYYQQFPEGEDASWKSFSSWWESATVVVLYMIPADFMFKSIGRRAIAPVKTVVDASRRSGFGKTIGMGYEAVKKSISKLKDDAFLAVGIGKGNTKLNRLEEYALKSGLIRKVYYHSVSDEVVKTYKTFGELRNVVDDASPAFKALAKAQGTEADAWTFLQLNHDKAKSLLNKPLSEKIGADVIDFMPLMKEDAQKAVAQKVFLGIKWDQAKKTMLYFGFTGIATYFGKLSECELLKSEPIGGSMLLMRALKCSLEDLKGEDFENPAEIFDTTYQLNGVEIGKPVVLDKGYASGTGVVGNFPTKFYLASPCHGDLKVESRPIRCYGYEHDAITGVTQCDQPDLGEIKEQPMCGSFLAKTYLADSLKDLLESRNEDKRRLFVYINQKLEKIKLPPLGLIGNDPSQSTGTSVEKIQKLDNCKPYERRWTDVASVQTSANNPLVIEEGQGDKFSCYKAEIYYNDQLIDTIDPATAQKRGGDYVTLDSPYFICGDKESHAESSDKNSPIDRFFRFTYLEKKDNHVDLSLWESYCIIRSEKLDKAINRNAITFFSHAKRDAITAGTSDELADLMIFTVNDPIDRLKAYTLSFTDENPPTEPDAFIDTITIHENNMFRMADSDEDGRIDYIKELYGFKPIRLPSDPTCTVDAVVVSVESKKQGEKYNFCYSSEDMRKQIAGTAFDITILALSSSLGPVSGAYRWVARGVQGGIAYLVFKPSIEWPNW